MRRDIWIRYPAVGAGLLSADETWALTGASPMGEHTIGFSQVGLCAVSLDPVRDRAGTGTSVPADPPSRRRRTC